MNANDNGQTLADLVNSPTQSLASQGCQTQQREWIFTNKPGDLGRAIQSRCVEAGIRLKTKTLHRIQRSVTV